VIDLPRVVPTEGDIYVHVAVDVCTPAQIPDLLYPAEGGSDVADVLAAVRPQHTALVRGLLAAAG
jgi:arginase